MNTKIDEIVIRPYFPKKTLPWEEFYKKIKITRAFKGKGRLISLSEFIAKDRETHF